MADKTQDIYGLFKSKPELLHNNLQVIACAGSGKTEFISFKELIGGITGSSKMLM